MGGCAPFPSWATFLGHITRSCSSHLIPKLHQMDVKQLWKRRKARLQSRFPYIDGNTERPWLLALDEEGVEPLKIGCALCLRLFGAQDAAQSKTLAAFPPATLETLRIPKLLRHEQLKVHRRALEKFATQANGQIAYTWWAPSVEQMRETWEATQKGNQVKRCRSKARRIIFCLAEAIRSYYREELRDSKCISISQDGSETRQLVRFASSSSAFRTTTGVLGSWALPSSSIPLPHPFAPYQPTPKTIRPIIKHCRVFLVLFFLHDTCRNGTQPSRWPQSHSGGH